MEYHKICKLCGKSFVAKSNRAEVCKDVHTSVCCVCGKTYVLKPPYSSQTCSLKCGQQIGNVKRRRTMQDKYGVDNPMQIPDVVYKAQQTSLNKYGVDNPSKSDQIKDKIKQHFLDTYQVTNAMQIVQFKNRQQDSVELHYGVRSPLQSDVVLDRMRRTNLIVYGCANVLANAEIRAKIAQERYTRTGYYNPSSDPAVKAKIVATCEARYGVPYTCMRPECRSSYRTISKINLAFGDLLSANSIDFEMEFALNRYSYDFKIAEKLIEVDPSITHNTMMSIFPDTDPLDPNYHKNKSDLAAQNGYRCIHVFDWDDWNKIVDLVRPCVDIFARKCKLKQIDTKTADRFTAMYHISGRCNGQKLNYGLYYDGELVEVMTFGKPRYNSKYDFELLRLCSKSGVRVVGGASKLFAQFRKDNPEATVISYCDLSKFSGAVYEKIGMQILNYTAPNKVWSKNNKKITQNLLNQRGYDQLFHTNFGKGTSNEQLMLDNGWLPVYDCGQAVYVI